MVVHPVPGATLVDLVEKARRDQMQRWGIHLVWWVCILVGFTVVGGHGTFVSIASVVLRVVAFLALGFAVFEFLVRPKPVPVAGVVQPGFFSFKMVATKTPAPGRIRIVPCSGRLTFREGSTWVPSAQSQRRGLGTTKWLREDIAELRVERVRNLTPLGYLHLRPTGSAEITFRIFQPKRLRPLRGGVRVVCPAALWSAGRLHDCRSVGRFQLIVSLRSTSRRGQLKWSWKPN